MNKTERIKLLNEKVCWTLAYKASNESHEFDTYDDVVAALRRDKNHYSSLERDKTVDEPFSAYIDKAIDMIESAQADIKESFETNPDTVLNRLGSGLGFSISVRSIHQDGVTRRNPTITLESVVSAKSEKVVFSDYGYKEMYLAGNKDGYRQFLDLVFGRSRIPELLNYGTDDSRVAAVAQYLALVMREYAYPSKYQLTKNKIAGINEAIDVSNARLDDLRNEAETFIQENNEALQTKQDERQQDFDQFKEETLHWNIEKEEALSKLEATYEEKLRLKAPVKYWEEISAKKKRSFRIWLGFTSLVSFVLVCLVSWLFCLVYSQPQGVAGQLIPLSFIVVALIALLIYAVRTLVKITMTERHLSTEYEEKAHFTHFYLALLQNEGVAIKDQERLLIFNTIFSRVDTGLIKASSDSEIGFSELAKVIAGKGN